MVFIKQVFLLQFLFDVLEMSLFLDLPTTGEIAKLSGRYLQTFQVQIIVLLFHYEKLKWQN